MAFASTLFFALACCLLHLSHGFDWKQCGEGSFSVNDVTLTPQQVKPGDTAEFKITADSGELQGWVVPRLTPVPPTCSPTAADVLREQH